MVDLSSEMETLLEALGPPRGRAAKLVQFVAAKAGEGTSTVAREFARAAVERSEKGVWLIELDLMRGEQHGVIAGDPREYGDLGEPTKASPDGSMFFTVQPPVRGVDGRPWSHTTYLAAYAVGGQRLWVTRFRREALRAGQSVQIIPKGDYWAALKPHADYVVVDAPSAERSRAGLAVSRFMDANVLVVAADSADKTAPARLRDDIEAAGGRCAGLVFNKAPSEPPAFVRKLVP